jgi:exopolysaccharide biosynthesis polyprenyl glycosylphosphotransferase
MSERILILGTSPLAVSLAAEIRRRARSGMRLLGVIGENRNTGPAHPDCPVLGSLEDMSSLISEHAPDRVIVALAEQRGLLLADRLVETQVHQRIAVETGTEAYERLTGQLALESLKPSNVLFTTEFRPSRRRQWLARAFSVTSACIGFLICLPLMAVIATAVRLDSHGPALFIQERIGFGGRRFRLLKFRTMHAASGVHSEWARDNSGRITRVGRYLRKFRLDELPQFINVLRGDMNLVGPRPHPESNRNLFILVSRNTPQCGEQIPYYSLRSSVRPGITGWAQVRYKYANGLDEEMEKLRYDLYYVKHYSLLLDLRILFETVKVVLLGHESEALPDTGRNDQSADVTAEARVGEPLLPGLAAALQEQDTSGRRRSTARGLSAGMDRL